MKAKGIIKRIETELEPERRAAFNAMGPEDQARAAFIISLFNGMNRKNKQALSRKLASKDQADQ